MTPTSSRPKVAIIGAGAIGLSIGWRLARRGCAVDIVEARSASIGASWAAAGMLGHCAELVEDPNPRLIAFNTDSIRAWPRFLADLEQDTKRPFPIDRTGTFLVGDDEAAQTRTFQCLKQADLPVSWLTAAQTRSHEPALAQGLTAIYCHEDGCLNPRSLIHALAMAFEACGGTIRYNTPVRGIVGTDSGARNCATGLRTDHGVIEADRIILCAGWRTPHVLENGGIVGDIALPQTLDIEPVKGEIAALETPDPLVSHVIRSDGIYLVPRDRTLVVGATVLPGRTDEAVDTDHINALRDRAARLVPAIASLNVAEAWTGIRPRTLDNLPYLGPTGVHGLLIAAGHFRNGILWTPLTSEIISGLVLDDPQPADLSPFRPGRDRT